MTTPARRAFPRRKPRGTARHCLSGRPFGPWKPARAVDICEDGIGLVVNEPLPAGALVDVELSPPGGQKDLTCTAEVRRVASLSDGTHLLGCRWERRPAFAELQKFI
jgi:hypothetical protein